MFVNKDEIKKAFKEGKLRTSEDLKDFLPKLIKEAIETMYEGELSELLGYESYDKKSRKTDNYRNGYSEKTVKSNVGEIELSVPRDRDGEFDPKVVKKRQTEINGLEEHIISMYAKGITVRDIQGHMKEIYGLDFSPEAMELQPFFRHKVKLYFYLTHKIFHKLHLGFGNLFLNAVFFCYKSTQYTQKLHFLFHPNPFLLQIVSIQFLSS
jgi:hypothetical protein